MAGKNKSPFVADGEMVEGAKCEIYTRKESLKGLHRDPITSKMMTKYELTHNCSVEVTKALNLSNEEKQLRDQMNVHGEVGDKIKGHSISLFIDQKRPVRIEVKEGTTHTHGGHLISTTNRTIGYIKYVFKNQKLIPEFQKQIKDEN